MDDNALDDNNFYGDEDGVELPDLADDEDILDDALSALVIDDTLSLIERVQRYINSEHDLHRLFTTKLLADAAEEVSFEVAMATLLPLVDNLMQEEDSAVIRQALGEQLAPLTAVLVRGAKKLEEEHMHQALKEVKKKVLEFVANLLVDDSQQVCQSGQEALVTISSLFQPDDVNAQVLTVVLGLAHSEDSEEHRISALELFKGLAPLLGEKLVLTFGLDQFLKLSRDPMFKVRKATGSAIGAIAGEIHATAVEERVLPIVLELSTDKIWSVRKGVCESLHQVAKAVPDAVRHTTLLDLCVSFLKDESRWVRKCMFQHVGPFLHTMAREQVSGTIVKQWRDMVLPEANCEDKDYFMSCAYNLPAVAAKLGSERWVEIREIFDVLVASDQWKVRRCIAYGLHEYARVLGPDQSEALLLPAFGKCLTDLDEVKVGALSSLDKFVSNLSEAARVRALPMIAEACTEDNLVDWRIREILASQLGAVCSYYEPEVVHDTLQPIGLRLWMDEVSKVRNASCALPGAFFARVRGRAEWEIELIQTIQMAGRARGWVSRQVYALTCRELVGTMQVELFKSRLLPQLLTILDDRVANVRIALAQALDVCVGHSALLQMTEVGRAVEQLLNDEDGDVREAAHYAKEIADGCGGLRT